MRPNHRWRIDGIDVVRLEQTRTLTCTSDLVVINQDGSTIAIVHNENVIVISRCSVANLGLLRISDLDLVIERSLERLRVAVLVDNLFAIGLNRAGLLGLRGLLRPLWYFELVGRESLHRLVGLVILPVEEVSYYGSYTFDGG